MGAPTSPLLRISQQDRPLQANLESVWGPRFPPVVFLFSHATGAFPASSGLPFQDGVP